MTKYIVGPADEIPPGTRTIKTINGRSIGIFNIAGEYFALLNRCPHQGAPLCLGTLVGLVTSSEPGKFDYARPGEMLKCPSHGWEYDVRTGQSWCDPKDTRVKAYEVTVEPGETLAKGPFVAETFAVAIEQDYIVIEV